MFHLLYHLHWQPRGRNLKGKSVLQLKFWRLILFCMLWCIQRSNALVWCILERRGKTQGERERKAKEHWFFYGGAKAWARDEGETKSRTWKLAWWASGRTFYYCKWSFSLTKQVICRIVGACNWIPVPLSLNVQDLFISFCHLYLLVLLSFPCFYFCTSQIWLDIPLNLHTILWK